MDKPLFLWYPKCSTCQRAAAWLQSHNIDITKRDIVLDRPTYEELSEWVKRSGIDIRKFFNTSGMRYRALNLSSVVRSATQDDLLKLLSSDGMLVKRPILIDSRHILIGLSAIEAAFAFCAAPPRTGRN